METQKRKGTKLEYNPPRKRYKHVHVKIHDVRINTVSSTLKTREIRPGVQTSIIPGHMDDPISNHESEMLMEYDMNWWECHRHRTLKQILLDLHVEKTIFDKDACQSPWICIKNMLIHIGDRSIYYDTKNLKYMFEIFVNATLINYQIQYAHFSGNIATNRNEIISKCRAALVTDPLIYSMFKDKVLIEAMKDKICYIELTRGEMIQLANHLYIEPDLFIMECKHHGRMVGSTKLLLAVMDKIQSRCSLYMYWKLCDTMGKYNISIYDHGKRIIEFLESHMVTLGDKIFEVVKNWEPLNVGRIIAMPGDLGFKELLATTIKDLKEVCGSKVDVSILISELTLGSLKDSDDKLHLSIELTGLSKAFGYPCLNVEKAVAKSKKVGSDRPDIDIDFCKTMAASFVRTFCHKYYMRHGRWPKGNYPQQLMRYIYKHQWPDPVQLSKISLALWQKVVFHKNFNYDYSLDTAELLKDTACAPHYSDWFTVYDECAFKIRYNKRIPKTKPGLHRRVMLRYLQGTKNEAKHITDNVNKVTSILKTDYVKDV